MLIIETSHQPGLIALAEGNTVRGERRLDEARRHARDLAPAMAALLAEQGWRARDLHGVIVSRGPGSYTGLRVGIMSAKTLAYATGARLLGVETFAAISQQAPAQAGVVDVVADAQQNNLYVQRYERIHGTGRWQASTVLAITSSTNWVENLAPGQWISGPGLANQGARLPSTVELAPQADWHPHAPSLLSLGLERWERGDRDDPFALEPIYLRPSSAEEKWGQV